MILENILRKYKSQIIFKRFGFKENELKFMEYINQLFCLKTGRTNRGEGDCPEMSFIHPLRATSYRNTEVATAALRLVVTPLNGMRTN